MKMTSLKMLALAATVMFATACSEDEAPVNETPTLGNVAEVASSDARFSILVDALGRTGLANTVATTNNITVFAPTNDAFNNLFTALGVADLDGLVNALGVDATTNVLLYHVLGARVPAANVTTGYVNTLGTVDSNPLSAYISVSGSTVTINGNANVVQTDVNASNGVIHAIDAVILPLTIVELAALNPDFTSLVTAAGVADGNIDDLLGDPTAGPFTVFAPTNAAFATLISELGASDLNGVVAAVGTDGVADVLLYHAVPGNIRSNQVTAGTVATANGQSFTITVNGGVSITDANNGTANVIATDVQGVNGVIHVIDRVLLPVL